MKRLRKLLAMTVMLFVLMAAAARGQSALDGFDPNANAGVRVVVVQPDGKILIGGDFTSVLGVARNRIARLNPDGTLDTAFNPNANGTVYSIAVQADGKVLAAGFFSGANSIGGQTRNRIARLDATTGAADSFDPNANSQVNAIAVQADGKILVGGTFNGANSIGGQTRNRIVRLDATTGLADSFNPNANGTVHAVTVQADGKILAGGLFTSIGGQTRNRIARLDATTGLPDSFNPNANNQVVSIAVQADGKILAGGFFSGANSIGGQTRNNIARLDATTGLADSFNPNANSGVNSIAVQADGKVLTCGFFSGANSIGGQTRNFIARLDATSGLADSFDPNANSGVDSIAVQADGKILVGGTFITLAPNGGASVTRNRIARLETDGRLDQTLNLSILPAGISNVVLATAVQPDGKILIGGIFTSVLGVARNNIARLNTDGTLDTTFDPNANPHVLSIAVQADGKILAGGVFTSIGGQTRNRIARLDATTGAADSFDPNANNTVFSIVVQADGKILAGGSFASIGGQTRNNVARLDATTGLADSFNPNANNTVFSIAVQADGKILAGGSFASIGGQTRNNVARLDATTGVADSLDPNANGQVYSIAVQADGKILAGGVFGTIGGQTRNSIARLDATTGLADSFNPNANQRVSSIAVQADGKILVGGDFTSIGGQPRNAIARLDTTTGLADSFNPNANNIVNSIAVQADGKILAGGFFTTVSGQTRSLFARLTNDTAALQNLAVTQTTITWSRGGSSAQFRRVTFESSNDNVNYAPLGNGTATGSNWTLTGLSLLTGQNIYIRARGYYRSGYTNGSESLTESVRNAFVAGPTATPTPNGTPTPTPVGTPTPTPTASGTPTPTATPTLPVITSPLVATGTVGLPFTYQLEASGATSLTAGNLAPGLTFNTSVGAITGIPTTAGTFQVALSATNSGGTTNATLTITVQLAPPSGPVIISSTAATGRTGRPFTFQLRTIGSSSATRFAVENVLPPGFNLDPLTGFISGTPTSDGNFSLAVAAIDGTAITRGTLQLTFTSDPTVPIITSPATAILTPGQFFTYSITADANGTFGYIGSDGIVHAAPSPSCAGLPAGLCFDGDHTISGTFNPPFGSDRKSPTPPDQTGGVITNVELFGSGSGGTGILSETYFLEPTGAGNIATRLAVGTGENVLIGGFIIEGNAPKKVVIRAIGPSLTQFGVPNAIADPVLELNEQTGPLSSNDNWRDNPGQADQIIAAQLQPSDDREAAILAYLNPGPYTALVRGKNNSTGNALVEVYDLGTAILADTSNSRLANIATRGTVLGGDSVMIGGFIIRRADTRVVIRAIGPSLTAFGISGALPDPTLELKNANGVTLIGNDDWQSDPTQAAEIQQRLLAPGNPRESALVRTLAPGQYTAVVSGKGGATGVAVVEGYTLSNP